MKTITMNRTIRGGAAALALAGLSMGFAGTSAQAADASTWDALAQCESGGNWNANTGNGFFGGIQFTQQSWNGVGMSGSPANASRAEQIQAGERLLAQQGWGAWPACSAKLGLSGKAGANPAAAQAPVQQQAPQQQAYQAPKQQAPVQQAPQQNSSSSWYTSGQKTAGYQAPQQQAPVEQSADTVEYTIQSGDTLGKIAEKFNVKGGWKALYQANQDKLISADLIITGQTIEIPAAK
ncbi:transglycosylase family protein [Arthrobacter sp. UM1]|uniref:LysM peptidoglycan-binding domain-containing protein n=1 Tax=Arthrobacter sp. UM1 TaxID=2766776 RepID=UPI001CF6ACF8|nr:transglycosylase family protein [Arthrobacter sp. UM1]MCB4208666.1 LysM peptidoglycan-binding domain-containing protein [Arthrobacter sp. UM1]